MIRLPAALACALLCLPAVAHSPLPDADWCAHGRVDVVGSFSYNGEQLYSQLAMHYCPDAPRNCGEFDHAYERAMAYANTTCAAYQGSLAHGSIGQVIAFVMSPATYLAHNHHAVYDVDEGLSGYCLRCSDPRAALPIGPRDPYSTR